MYQYPDAVIMVFCKAPIPGQVKTRLMPHLTGEEAAQLHCELTEKTLYTATKNNLCEVQLWCAPTIEHAFFTVLPQKYSVELFVQQGIDLGERMHQAFCQALARYHTAIIIGCDCPSLTANDIEQAISQLAQDKQCVLAPAEDGGYVLIGLKQPQPILFEEMPWGTSEVLELTRAKLQNLNFDYHELNRQWDLDTLDDLKRYRSS
jgi:uncharacterized protein